MNSALVLVITEGQETTLYDLTRLYPDRRIATVGWRLRKDLAGDTYDVHADQHGIHCTCKGYIYSKADPQTCRHIKALRDRGLLPGGK